MGVSFSANSHEDAFSAIPKRVWFNGSTALKEGQGLCYNWDVGSAAAADGRRANHVEVCTILNAPYFAGVADEVYAAVTGGQFITINLPGSYCNIWSNASTTIGVGVVTCSSDTTNTGIFKYAGFPGRGTATPLQTINRATVAGVCFAYLQVGKQSGLVDLITAAVAGGAVTAGVHGITILDTVGQAVLTGADVTFTVADGTIPYLKKGFRCIVDAGDSYDFIMTVNGIQLDGSTAQVTIILDDVSDEDHIEWTMGDWYERARSGATVT